MSRRSVRATPRGFETAFAIRDSSDVVSLRRLLPFGGSIGVMSIFQQLTFGFAGDASLTLQSGRRRPGAPERHLAHQRKVGQAARLRLDS